MIAELIFAAQLALPRWFDDASGLRLCQTEVQPGVYTDCTVKVGEQFDPDTGITSDVWMYGKWVWAGNPYCVSPAMNMIPTNPQAYDKGACRPVTTLNPPSGAGIN